jgi:hypothetical protein
MVESFFYLEATLVVAVATVSYRLATSKLALVRIAMTGGTASSGSSQLDQTAAVPEMTRAAGQLSMGTG